MLLLLCLLLLLPHNLQPSALIPPISTVTVALTMCHFCYFSN